MNAPYPPFPLDVHADAFRAACELDVLAFKPGNVGIDSPGHGMTARDFLTSAEVAAPHLANRALGVGERIYRAIEATRHAVACNTNLGIVLLAAPLIHAAQRREDRETLADALRRGLAGIDLEQTAWVFRAIRLAAPGGLGKSARHDVNKPPEATLLTAMREASRRDCIARQYANGYADLFDACRTDLVEARGRWNRPEQQMTALFLGFLADYPDSHIARKHGAASAEGVRQMARRCRAELRQCANWADARKPLEQLDRQLKSDGINPGTSADLSVATWLLDRLQHRDSAFQPNRMRRTGCSTSPGAD